MINESFLLRMFWGIVGEIPEQQSRCLSDAALLSTLLEHLSCRVQLTAEEMQFLCSYIGLRVPLIRDVIEPHAFEISAKRVQLAVG